MEHRAGLGQVRALVSADSQISGLWTEDYRIRPKTYCLFYQQERKIEMPFL